MSVVNYNKWVLEQGCIRIADDSFGTIKMLFNFASQPMKLRQDHSNPRWVPELIGSCTTGIYLGSFTPSSQTKVYVSYPEEYDFTRMRVPSKAKCLFVAAAQKGPIW